MSSKLARDVERRLALRSATLYEYCNGAPVNHRHPADVDERLCAAAEVLPPNEALADVGGSGRPRAAAHRRPRPPQIRRLGRNPSSNDV